MSNVEISIIIPAFNERERLPSYLKDWLSILPNRFQNFEIIVVDDGSTDGLKEFLAENNEFARVTVLSQPNQGKGAAVKKGMLRARGALRLFCDADGATPAEELFRLLDEQQKENFPVVIGSRKKIHGATTIKRNPFRHISGRIFAKLVSIITSLRVYDTQCGFKLFTADAVEKIFSRLETSGWAFDIEVLMIAKREGMMIKEVPVNWEDKSGSKVSFLKDAPRMFFDVLRIKRRLKSYFTG